MSRRPGLRRNLGGHKLQRGQREMEEEEQEESSHEEEEEEGSFLSEGRAGCGAEAGVQGHPVQWGGRGLG